MSHWTDALNQLAALVAELPTVSEQVDRAGRLMVDVLRAGGKVLACGNGGSASQASHLAAELVGRYRSPRRGLPALALSADGAVLSCVVNDYDPLDVFARQVQALAARGDLVVGLSTSGRSENVARALQAARTQGAATVALLGTSEAPDPQCVSGLADVQIVVPSSSTARVQEVHLLIIHTWCELVDQALGRE